MIIKKKKKKKKKKTALSFGNVISTGLSTLTSPSGTDDDDCPYNPDIETFVAALLSGIEKFVDLDSYRDEERLTRLRKRTHVKHHCIIIRMQKKHIVSSVVTSCSFQYIHSCKQ